MKTKEPRKIAIDYRHLYHLVPDPFQLKQLNKGVTGPQELVEIKLVKKYVGTAAYLYDPINGLMLAMGKAKLHPEDRFCKKTGRSQAVKDLMKKFNVISTDPGFDKLVALRKYMRQHIDCPSNVYWELFEGVTPDADPGFKKVVNDIY